MAEIYDGSLLRIVIGGKTVYHAQDCEVSMELSTRERSSKDIEGLQTAPDIISWSGSGSALGVMDLPAAVTNSLNFEGLFDAMNAKALLAVELTLGGDAAPGDVVYKGSAYLTSLSLNATNREDATASYSLTGSGLLEKDVIPTP